MPGGGGSFFPGARLVGFSGHPGSPALGRMGVGDLDDRVSEMVDLGEQEYTTGDRRTVPVLELITTVVHAEAGADGSYRTRGDDEVIAEHLAAAREVEGVLLLNIQPGRADMFEEVRHYEEWLREPDVGLALDPEWAVGEDEVPGQVYGSTSGSELDEISAWVAELVRDEGLPEKVVLYHQLHPQVVEDPADLKEHDGVVSVVSVDGIGAPADKVALYQRIVADTPDHVRPGFKLFYEEDVDQGGVLMRPEEVMDLEPRPEYVLYE